ncbi:MAG: hypothetical protein HY661_07575 [Betaproteobacteria bacterium]|nr:hypothetical protein [Betaproteobacteria bacterium]
MIALRAPNGLGDAIGLRAVVLHLLERGESVSVFTKWHDVFADLPITINPVTENTGNEDYRYMSFPLSSAIPPGTNDFTMRCRQLGITEPVKLQLKWKVRNHALLERIKRDARGRPIFVYQSARTIRSYASMLLAPRRQAFNKFVAKYHGHYRIKLGHPPHVPEDKDAPCELDMYGKAFILDTFDICTIADLFFGQASFITCMAEALDKPHICMFARAALRSTDTRANTTTPERALAKKHLATVVYDD